MPKRFRGLRVFVALFCAIAGGSVAQVEFEPGAWSWESDVAAEDAPEGFVRLELTPEALDAARPSLADLRVVNGRNELVAHVMARPRTHAKAQWRAATLTNQVFTIGEFARVTADFGARERRNQIRVTLSGENYRRFAQLEGSEDGRDWATVDTAWLFHYRDGGQSYDATTIRFPANDFRYLRLTAYNMEDEPNTIQIRRVETCEVVADPEETPVAVTVDSVEPAEDDGNVTIFDIDSGYRNLPIASLRIAPMTPYFYRRYELLGRDAPRETYERREETGMNPAEREVPWRLIASGVFYRVERDDGEDEDLVVDPVGASYRYYRLRILNGDDAPLDVAQQDIFLTRHALSTVLFDYRPSQAYRLFLGNAEATAPSYDLARAVSDLDDRTLPGVEVGPLRAVVGPEEVVPFLQRYRNASWLVLVLVVAVMGLLIARNLRNVQRD